MERFAREWWLNLDDAINTDNYMDTVNVHRFDPPSKYRGGAGVTGLLEEGTAAATIDKCVSTVCCRFLSAGFHCAFGLLQIGLFCISYKKQT